MTFVLFLNAAIYLLTTSANTLIFKGRAKLLLGKLIIFNSGAQFILNISKDKGGKNKRQKTHRTQKLQELLIIVY